MRGQKLRGAFTDKRNPHRIDQPRQAGFSCWRRFQREGSARTFPPSARAPRAFPGRACRDRQNPSPSPSRSIWTTIFSPSPSIFIAWRPAKCRNDSPLARRARNIHAAVSHLAFGPVNAHAAHRAFRRHAKLFFFRHRASPPSERAESPRRRAPPARYRPHGCSAAPLRPCCAAWTSTTVTPPIFTGSK